MQEVTGKSEVDETCNYGMSNEEEYPEKKKTGVNKEVSPDYRLECERREWLAAYYADLACRSDKGMEMHQ